MFVQYLIFWEEVGKSRPLIQSEKLRLCLVYNEEDKCGLILIFDPLGELVKANPRPSLANQTLRYLQLF